jgi:hypothetical protein
MCGVTGYWAYSSHGAANAMFAVFIDSLARRGPEVFY